MRRAAGLQRSRGGEHAARAARGRARAGLPAAHRADARARGALAGRTHELARVAGGTGAAGALRQCSGAAPHPGGLMSAWSPDAWRDIVEAAPEGIVVCDATVAGNPVIYANSAFAQMCGYPVAALLGTNLRMLQGADREQEGRQRLREALERNTPCRVLIRNYRPDGTLFWNEMLIQPVRDTEGRVVQWVGYHRDASDRLRTMERSAQGLPAWMREDRLTGLHSRAYFEELVRR